MKLLHIGRAITNDIVISDQTVSRQHAQLIVDDLGQATLIDLNSANGIFVNGQRITGPRKLELTDIVKLGDHLFPWQNYVGPDTGIFEINDTQEARTTYSAPVEYPTATKPGKKWMPIAIGGILMVGLVVLLLVLFTGKDSLSKTVVGKWVEKDSKDNWIDFQANGNYQEGYRESVYFEDGTWKEAGPNQIEIERDGIKTLKHIEIKNSGLIITHAEKSIEYQPAP